MSQIIDNQINHQYLLQEKKFKNSLKHIFQTCQINQQKKQTIFTLNIDGLKKNPNLNLLISLSFKLVANFVFFTFDFTILKNGLPQTVQKSLRLSLSRFLLNLNSKIKIGQFLININDGRLKFRSSLTTGISNNQSNIKVQKGDLNFKNKTRNQKQITSVTFSCIQTFVYHYWRIMEFINKKQEIYKKIYHQNQQHGFVSTIFKKEILVLESTAKLLSKPFYVAMKMNFNQKEKKNSQILKEFFMLRNFYQPKKSNLLKSQQLMIALEQNCPKKIGQLSKIYINQSTSIRFQDKKEKKQFLQIELYEKDECLKIHQTAQIQLKVIKGIIIKNNKREKINLVVKESKTKKGYKKIKYEKVIIKILYQLEKTHHILNYFQNFNITSNSSFQNQIKDKKYQKQITHNSQQYLLMEFLKIGSLRTFLQTKKDFLSLHSKLQILIKIQKSLQSIHSSQIEHLDLKPENILLDKKFNFKIIDFGQSYCYDKQFSQYMKQAAEFFSVGVSPPYSAPQLYRHLQKSSYFQKIQRVDYLKRDVFSFGIIMFEIIFEELPFSIQNQNLLYTKFKNNQYKQLINFPPEKAIKYGQKDIIFLILKLFFLCIDQDPRNRPDFEWIRVYLKKLHWIYHQF